MTAPDSEESPVVPDLTAEKPVEEEPNQVEQLEVFDPETETLILKSGFKVKLLPLKTRAFFKLLRILTRGAAPFLGDAQFRLTNVGDDDFMSRLSALLIIAVPEAEDEAIEFLQALVEPADLVAKNPSKDQIKANVELRVELINELQDPDIEDLVELINAIIQHEAKDIQSLGKRLQRMMTVATQAGVLQSTV